MSEPAEVVRIGDGFAKLVSNTEAGGVIELGENRERAMTAAVQLMERDCGKDSFVIVQEGIEALGHDADESASTGWRLHYQCQ